MTELLTLELVDKRLVTNQLVLDVGYDIDNLTDPEISKYYKGEVTVDRYGRKIPKHAHGTINLDHQTSSTKIIVDAAAKLFDRIIDKHLLVRRLNIVANNVIYEDEVKKDNFEQIDLFTNYEEKKQNEKNEEREKKMQRAVLDIKSKYGKNAIIKGMNLEEGGTTIQRNEQLGGHKS